MFFRSRLLQNLPNLKSIDNDLLDIDDTSDDSSDSSDDDDQSIDKKLGFVGWFLLKILCILLHEM